MSKLLDPRLKAVSDDLTLKGWKRLAYEHYKLSGDGFIQGIAVGKSKQLGIWTDIRWYSIELNELSAFVWDYKNPELAAMGLFSGFKLPIGRHLHGFDVCSLSPLTTRLYMQNLAEKIFEDACIEMAMSIRKKYNEVGKLIKLFEETPNVLKEDLIIMYLLIKQYEKAWTLLLEQSEYPPTPGHIFFGAWQYLRKNKLGVEPRQD